MSILPQQLPLDFDFGCVEAWRDLKFEDFVVKPLLGGLSNEIFLATCCRDNVEPAEGVVRVYGPFLSKDERRDEVITAQFVGDLGLGPKVLGVWGDRGRVEEFVHAHHLHITDLSSEQVQDSLAQSLAKLHKSQPPATHTTDSIPVCEAIQSLLHAAVTNFSQTLAKMVAKEGEISLVQSEATWLCTEIQKIVDSSEHGCVFCHNDLQEGNMLRLADESLKLIDFEYASLNPPAYDIANFFCEMSIDNFFPSYPGFSFDRERFPTEKAQKRFLRCYLTRDNAIPTNSQVDDLYSQVQLLVLASHLRWALWSVPQAHKQQQEAQRGSISTPVLATASPPLSPSHRVHHPPVVTATPQQIVEDPASGFDYFLYGATRLGAYFDFKAKMLRD